MIMLFTHARRSGTCRNTCAQTTLQNTLTPCRHRLTFLSTVTLLGRCALACTFLLLPPAAWPTHTWAGYVVSASSRPLANALALSVYDQFAKVRRRRRYGMYSPSVDTVPRVSLQKLPGRDCYTPYRSSIHRYYPATNSCCLAPLASGIALFAESPLAGNGVLTYELLCPVQVLLPGATLHALAQTAGVFLLAYLVAPTIVTMQRQQLQLYAGPVSDVELVSTSPVPLQCGLRPEHSALLPCRPLALQVLLGLAMVAWPVWLSWAVERRLRRQHAELCQDWGSQPWGREEQQQVHAVRYAVREHQQRTLRSTSLSAAAPLSLLRRHSWFGHATRPGGTNVGADRAPGGALPARVPAAVGGGSAGPGSSRPGEAQGAVGAAAASVRYRSPRTSVMVSLKVRTAQQPLRSRLEGLKGDPCVP